MKIKADADRGLVISALAALVRAGCDACSEDEIEANKAACHAGRLALDRMAARIAALEEVERAARAFIARMDVLEVDDFAGEEFSALRAALRDEI